MERMAGGNTRRRTRRSLSFCGTALTCASKGADPLGTLCGEVRRSGKLFVFSAIGKLSVCTSVKVRECYNEVEQEDEDPHKEGNFVVRMPTLAPSPA